MNPAILGALIGAVPGTVAAALTTWASVRAGRVSLQQTQLTQLAEHANWLRDKRADLYVELLAIVREAKISRHKMITPDVTKEALCQAAPAVLDSHKTADMQDRIARSYAFASRAAGEAFRQAWEADLDAWRAATEEITQYGRLTMSGKLAHAMEQADSEVDKFRELARQDLLTPPADDLKAGVQR